jgi:hypothetical protein
VSALGCWSALSLLHRAQMRYVHQPKYSLFANNFFFPGAASPGSRRHPYVFSTLSKDFDDSLRQDFIAQSPRGPGLLQVVIPSASTHPQPFTQFPPAKVDILSHSSNYFVKLFGSWPKMTNAFFRMSRCRLTVSNSRSNFAFSSSKADKEPPVPGLSLPE